MAATTSPELPFHDRQDFDDADRGFIGAMEPCIVMADDGRVVWDNDAYEFLSGDCPKTANPSLWRQSQRCAKQGPYEVTDGIYRDGVPIVAGHGFMEAAVAENVYAGYLNEAIDLFADDMDVAFASHHWPVWDRDRVVTYLSRQRDLYAYLHDQTPRLLNQGYTGIEIAELVEMPPELAAAWHTHGYHGSVSHNVKAIYQRYLGWFGGKPAHLWQHPPAESATRYVDCLGGSAAVMAKAQAYIDHGDLRFARVLLNHVVFAGDSNTGARSLLAGVYDTLGFGSENGTRRNFYLQGAYELRNGVQPAALDPVGSPDMVGALWVEQLFDSLAIRVNGPEAWEVALAIDWVFTDLGHTYRTALSHGVLIQDIDPTRGTSPS